jgi:hypothetical protein
MREDPKGVDIFYFYQISLFKEQKKTRTHRQREDKVWKVTAPLPYLSSILSTLFPSDLFSKQISLGWLGGKTKPTEHSNRYISYT